MRKQEAERLERIRANEEKMDRCLAALSLIQTALEQWRAVQEDLRDLEVYYTGADWKRDYAADEQGLVLLRQRFHEHGPVAHVPQSDPAVGQVVRRVQQ